MRDCFSDISEISSLRRIYSDWRIDKDTNNVVEESKAVNDRSIVSSALPGSCGAGQNMLDLICARADFCAGPLGPGPGKKVGIGDAKNLYEYWGELLYRSVIDDSRIIINLASKEYSKCIEKYLTPQDRYITIVFCELSGDKLVTKGTYAKMARGEMVRFIAENNIENLVEIQKFDRLGYSFRSDLSSDSEYVFERKIK